MPSCVNRFYIHFLSYLFRIFFVIVINIACASTSGKITIRAFSVFDCERNKSSNSLMLDSESGYEILAKVELFPSYVKHTYHIHTHDHTRACVRACVCDMYV